MIDDASRTLRDEHRGAADIVVYGFPVERKPRETPTEAAPDATATEPAATPAKGDGEGNGAA